MSDVSLAKMKAIYADIIATEKSIAAIEKSMMEKLRVLERRYASRAMAQRHADFLSLALSVKPLIFVAVAAFAAGVTLSLTPSFKLAVIAGIPAGMLLAWLYLGRSRSEVPTHGDLQARQIWSESDFISAVAALGLYLDSPTVEACKLVLVNGADFRAASKKCGATLQILLYTLSLIERHREKLKT